MKVTYDTTPEIILKEFNILDAYLVLDGYEAT